MYTLVVKKFRYSNKDSLGLVTYIIVRSMPIHGKIILLIVAHKQVNILSSCSTHGIVIINYIASY